MDKMIILNQKMYLNTLEEIHNFQKEIISYKDNIVVMPSYIYLKDFIDKGFIVGAQNVSDSEAGAFTGEVSARSLKDMGVLYVLIGHCEVLLKNQHEKDLILRKIKCAIKNGLKVIYCIGETLEQHKSGKTFEVIKESLKDIPNDVYISYEPIWTVGRNIVPTNEEVESAINIIKQIIDTKVFYGGSVNENNINKLNEISNLDGYLIGSAGISYKKLVKILEVVD